MTRSAFIRQALELALRHYQILEMEKQHAEGYAANPVEPGEFDLWENEQAWGEGCKILSQSIRHQEYLAELSLGHFGGMIKLCRSETQHAKNQ